ncbi:MAG: glycosyl hydrolase family 28 protein [Asticcacaulis sp.]
MQRHIFIALSLMLSTIGFSATAQVQSQNTLQVYEVPRELLYTAHNDDFTVRVRTPGGPWQNLYEYRIRVDKDTGQNASLVYFDFTGKVELEIQKNNGRFTTAEMLPQRQGMRLEHDGAIVRMTLDKPERFSIQFDSDRLNNLHILAGAIPEDKPEAGAIVYGPGFHTPADGSNRFPVKSGDRIYLAPGAVLRGSFALNHVKDVKILGRGLLYNPGHAIDLDGASNIEVRDIIIVNDDRADAARIMNIRNSENVSVKNLSGFTAGKWADGFNISTSRHVTLDGGYLRVSDDAVVVYAVTDCPICKERPIRPVGPPGAAQPADTFDITARNLTIWNDVAHALFISYFGDPDAPRTISDVTFENIDVVNFDEDDLQWDGVMALYSGNATLIKNITFSDIRIHRIEEGRLFNIVAGQTKLTIASAQANTKPGRGIEGVTIRNISYDGKGMPGRSIITGMAPGTEIKDIKIENLRIAGKLITSKEAADIEVGPYVTGFSIK